MAVKVDLRLMLDRAYVAAKNSGIGFNVATIPANFNAPSRGPFDPDYMKALFDAGYDQGKSANRVCRCAAALSGSAGNRIERQLPNPTRRRKPGATK